MKEEAKRWLRLLALGVAGMLGVAIYREFEARTADHGPPSKVQLGAAAEIPDTSFRLPLAQGGLLTSEELKGRPVILNFWASWCDACKQERPELEKLKGFAGDRIIGVGTQDDKDKIAAFDQAHPHGYRIIIDDSGDLAAKFRVTGLPHTFLLDAQGKVLARVVGSLKPADVAELKRLYEATANPR